MFPWFLCHMFHCGLTGEFKEYLLGPMHLDLVSIVLEVWSRYHIFSPLILFHVSFGLVIIVAIAFCKSKSSICWIFFGIFFLIVFIHFLWYCCDDVTWFRSNRCSTHSCLLSTFKQFVMFPSSPFFCVMFSTLVKHIPEPVQNIGLSFGCWSIFGVTVPIVLAQLNAT